MFTKIKEFCFNASTFWLLGRWKTGGFLATLFVAPIMYFFELLYLYDGNMYLPLFIFVFGLVSLIIHCALRHITDDDASVIIIGQACAFILAFAGIALGLRRFLVGYVLYHIFRYCVPFIFLKFWNITLKNLPSALGVMAGDCLAALLVNILLRIVLWIAY